MISNSFTPLSPWAAGLYSVRVASDVEDVCGNSVLAAFDRPLRPGRELAIETGNCSIPLEFTDSVRQHSYTANKQGALEVELICPTGRSARS